MRLFVGIILLAIGTNSADAQLAAPRTLEVPQRFTTIQAAIDSARSGDSVLVAPGRYRERVLFGGKSIVLASRFARTRDPRDILATIIDGSGPAHPDSGTTVMIVDREDSTTVLEGFTIIGGPGSVWFDAAGRTDFREGGGVLCELSSPTIRFNRIIGGHAVEPRDGRVRSSGGGGIRCGYAEPTIEGNLIAGNRGRYGAGLVLFHSAGVVRNNVVAGNSGGEDFGGAGVWIVGNLSRRLATVFRNNTVVENSTLSVDSGTARSFTGKGGGATFARTNIRGEQNLFAGNSQMASRQVAMGPGVQGAVGAREESGVTTGERLGAFGVPAQILTTTSSGAFAGTVDARTRAVLRALVESTDSVASQAAGVDLLVRRAELLSADSAYGRRSGLGTALRLTEPLATDAIVIGPRTTLWRTAAALRQALAADTANAAATVTWAPIRGDVSADGTHGYTFGYLDIRGGNSPLRDWKYLAYWERDAAGQWRMIAHKRLPREAGEPQTAPPAGFATPAHRLGSWFPGGEGTRAHLMATDSGFARLAQEGAVKAFIAYTARDGATLSGGANFAWGPEKVAAEFASFEPGMIDWAPDIAVVAPSGDLAYATGEVVGRQKKADGSVVEAFRGRYLTIWKRQPDGAWKLIIDG